MNGSFVFEVGDEMTDRTPIPKGPFRKHVLTNSLSPNGITLLNEDINDLASRLADLVRSRTMNQQERNDLSLALLIIMYDDICNIARSFSGKASQTQYQDIQQLSYTLLFDIILKYDSTRRSFKSFFLKALRNSVIDQIRKPVERELYFEDVFPDEPDNDGEVEM